MAAAEAIQVAGPDGSIIEFPAGTGDDVIKRVMSREYGGEPKKGQKAESEVRGFNPVGGFDAESITVPRRQQEEQAAPVAQMPYGEQMRNVGGAIDNTVRTLANGLPFMDRFAAGMGAITGIDGKLGDYSGNLEQQRAIDKRLEEAAPAATMAGKLIGGSLVPLGAVGAATKGATLMSKALLSGATGGAIGATQGLSDTPDLTNIPDAAKRTAVGGGLGFAVGAPLPAVARGIGYGYGAAANALAKADGMSRPTTKQLAQALKADTPAAVQGRLTDLGDDAMLADAGPALLGKAQGATLNSDEGRSLMVSALTRRNEGTNARITDDVNRALGPAEDPQTVTNNILAHRSAVDSVKYPAALDSAPPIDAASILSEIEKQIPRTVGMERKALENLRNMMLVKSEAESARSPTAVKPQPVKSEKDALAADVAAIREKYGEAAAEAYQRQQQPKSESLLEFLSSKGGLGPDAELEAIGALGHAVSVEGVGRRKLVKQGGLPLDYAREAAEEAGYLSGNHKGTSTVRDLLDAIDAEMRGQKLYPRGHEGSVSKREAAAAVERRQADYDRHMQGAADDLAAAGHNELGPEVRQRAIKLMADKGMTADQAVDHAVSQLEREEPLRRAAAFPGDKPSTTAIAADGAQPQSDAGVFHKIKQELDNVINYDAPGLGVPAGAVKNQQGALKRLRGQTNEVLENQVPGYREANAGSHALANRAEAVERGTQYLGSGKTTPSPERFAAEFEPLAHGEKIAFAKGSRGEIDRILGVKANDLQALRSELQGEGGWNTAKLAKVHGQKAADELVNSVERNLKFRDTHNKVVENSQTAQRTAAANAMKPEPPGEMPLFTPHTTGVGLFLGGAKKAANWALDGMRPDPTRHYGEIASVLSAQGSERDRHLRAMAEALLRMEEQKAGGQAIGNRAALAAALLENEYLRGRSGAR